MDRTSLSILICSSNDTTMRQMCRTLTGDGVQIQTSERLTDQHQISGQEWDYLLIDLDGLNNSLRGVLPAVCRKFPNLPKIGISTRFAPDIDILNQGFALELDAYLTEIPYPEDLIVLFPRVAEKYLCDFTVLKDLSH